MNHSWVNSCGQKCLPTGFHINKNINYPVIEKGGNCFERKNGVSFAKPIITIIKMEKEDGKEIIMAIWNT